VIRGVFDLASSESLQAANTIVVAIKAAVVKRFSRPCGIQSP
jgi:hypothetical protein